MRRTGRHARAQKKKMLVIGTISLLFVLTAGYAAYGTSLSLTAKGNIVENITTVSDTIKELSDGGDSTLVTVNNTEIRYSGATVNNYVKFESADSDDRLWRIIGIVDGKVKLVKATSLGEYSWDTSISTVNDGKGSNDWTDADLKTELNTYFLNSTSGTCYKGQNAAESVTCDFTNTGITDTAKTMIAETSWSLGQLENAALTVSQAYTNERAGNSWTGYVGLMYPSDYGYASKDCYSTIALSNSDEINDYRNSTCTSSNWLSGSKWLLTSQADSTAAFAVTSSGYVNSADPYTPYAIYPTVFLKDNVKIKEGKGTSSEPYILELVTTSSETGE